MTVDEILDEYPSLTATTFGRSHRRRAFRLSTMASKVWSAAELEQMSPQERRAIFDASIVTDLGQVPPEFLARVRARVERIIAETESTEEA